MNAPDQKSPRKNSAEVDKATTAYVKKYLPSSCVKEANIPYKTFLSDQMLIIQTIRNGIPYSFFEAIKKETPFTESEWADLMQISPKTLYRYEKADNHRFKPLHSEKIIELAEVSQLGKEVFDTLPQFYSWLTTPSLALGNMKPIELLKDSYGKEMVVNELNRIEYGIFV